MTEHDVVIVGGGPTGMMLGAELTLAGIDVLIVERRPNNDLDSSRARGLNARTLEVLDQRGVVDRFLAAGQAMQIHHFGSSVLDMSDFPTRYPHGLALMQRDFERIIGGWVGELGVPYLREAEVAGFVQDADGVDVELLGGRRLRARYLVGCDGGRSVVRKAAGIDFPGWDASASWLIAEAEMADEPRVGLLPGGGGIGPVDAVAGGNPYGIVLPVPPDAEAGPPTFAELRAVLVAAYGTDFGIRTPTWLSRFSDASRQAARYRDRRVLLAGDAAHVHGPQGGQGLNTGVQDAVNLGWKLAQVVRGTSADGLLDTYGAERHPVGARAMRMSMAIVASMAPGDRPDALRDVLGELLAFDDARRHVVGTLSGLGIRYDLGGEHPLVGRRVPDLDLQTVDGPARLYALLHDARPVLLDLAGGGAFGLAPWADRVRLVAAAFDGPWELPVVGTVAAPPALLIRPDGHVAWTGRVGDADLPRVLTAWFGPAVQPNWTSSNATPPAVTSAVTMVPPVAVVTANGPRAS